MRRHSLTGFRQGDHVCSLYEGADEQVVVASQFIGDGLRRGERCLFAADAVDLLNAFRANLEEGGIDVPYEEDRRSVILLTREQAWSFSGRFQPEQVIRSLNQEVEEALADGYTGFRACGDMSWLQAEQVTPTLVNDYESRCTDFFRSVRGLCMCLYDRRLLAAPLLHTALATHPSLFVEGRHRNNPYHDPVGTRFDDLSPEAFDRKFATFQADHA